MQQAIKPNLDIVTYHDLELNPNKFLIFLKDGDKIIGLIFKNEMEDFCLQTSSNADDVCDFCSLSEIIEFYSTKLKHEVTIWYEKVENCA